MLLHDLYNSGYRIDQRDALQLPLRGADHQVEAGKQAVHHHGNRDQGHQPQQHEFPGDIQTIRQGVGGGKNEGSNRAAFGVRGFTGGRGRGGGCLQPARKLHLSLVFLLGWEFVCRCWFVWRRWFV